MKVFVAGASGAIGRALVPSLMAAGHEVVALTRQYDRALKLRKMGAKAVIGDVFDLGYLKQLVDIAQPDAVIHQMTSIPQRIDPRHVSDDLAATNRLRTEGTRNLLEASIRARWFIAQSVAFAYRPVEKPATEVQALYDNAPREFSPIVGAVQHLESQVLHRRGGTVLRYGFFYGPGTAYAPGGSFHEDVMKRRIPIPGPGSGVFSFVHVKDAADATTRAIGKPGVFNIVDDDPAPFRTWLPYYAATNDAPRPIRIPGFFTRMAAGAYGAYLLQEQPGASNARARRELRWVPSFPSWRDGFRDFTRPALSA